jgi:hypothetical protein
MAKICIQWRIIKRQWYRQGIHDETIVFHIIGLYISDKAHGLRNMDCLLFDEKYYCLVKRKGGGGGDLNIDVTGGGFVKKY